MIRLHHLSKSFKGRPALVDLNLEVQRGEIFGLLGHNGAGKSTTFGLLLGQLHPTEGEAFIRNISVQADRQRALQGVGAIFETPAFYDYLSGWTNLKIFTSYTALVDAEEIMETVRFVGLESRIHDKVSVYSHGMRQRLALAQALLPTPELVLLDEPAEGLDPEGIHETRELILRLNRERGMTVVLSSHMLSEVEQLCHRIAILNKGRLVFEGRVSDLGAGLQQFKLEVDDSAKASALLATLAWIKQEADGNLSVQAGHDIADAVTLLVNGGVRVRAVEPIRRTLEELYLDTVSARSPSK